MSQQGDLQRSNIIQGFERDLWRSPSNHDLTRPIPSFDSSQCKDDAPYPILYIKLLQVGSESN